MTDGPRLSGTRADHIIKRHYLSRLQAAERRYDARMMHPRRRLRDAKDRARKLRRAGRVPESLETLMTALACFERARRRADIARLRRRRRAEMWLDRQDAPQAFRCQRHHHAEAEAA